MKIIRTTNLIPLNQAKTKVLLLRTSQGDGQPYKWTFPGQAMKKDENVEEIAQKISEKLLSSKTTKLIKFNTYETKTKNAVIKSHYYFGEIDQSITIKDNKYIKAQWYTLNEEIYFLDFLHNEKDILAEVMEKVLK